MSLFARSIRWRLQLWLAFLLVCILSGFGLTAYQLHRTNQFNQIDQELERRVAALGGVLRGRAPFEAHGGRPPFGGGGRPGRPPAEDNVERPSGRRGGPDSPPRRPLADGWSGFREIRIPGPVLNLFDEDRTNAFYFVIWSRDGTRLKSSTNAPADIPLPERESFGTATQTRMRVPFRESFYFTGPGECVLAGRSVATDLADLNRFAWWLLTAASAVLALGLGGGWMLAGHSMRPVEDISATASRISAGNLSDRISVAETDNELGRLAGVLNSTFARLEAAFAQQKQFTADASHELRTPITVLISEAQTALSRPRTADEYRETVEACLDTAQKMRRLTESLLELARFDSGQAQIERGPLDLASLSWECIELVRPLARQRGIQVQADLVPAEAVGDPDRLSQVLTNLLTNAIHYNKENGAIMVSTRTENDNAVLTVADTGPGIAAEDLPHIFDRFYRADKSRARSEGRNGLGLAIAKAVVDAHGGAIEVSSRPGAGTIFKVRLPK